MATYATAARHAARVCALALGLATGAKLWNGLYFKFERTEQGLRGKPQAIDLNRISAPPDQPGQPPYLTAFRDDIAPGARWIDALSIE